MQLGDLLASIGLNSTEQTVFSELLRLKSAGAGIIARATKLKRPTVYAALDELTRRNLIQRYTRNNVVQFSAPPIEMILTVLRDEERTRHERMQAVFEFLGPILERHQEKAINKVALNTFQVSLIHGETSVAKEINQRLSKADLLSIWNPQLMPASTRKLTAEYISTTAKSKPHIRELIPAGPVSDWYIKQIHNPNHSVRTLGPEYSVPVDLIFGSDWVMVVDAADGARDGLLIEHAGLAKIVKELFEVAWGGATIKP